MSCVMKTHQAVKSALCLLWPANVWCAKQRALIMHIARVHFLTPLLPTRSPRLAFLIQDNRCRRYLLAESSLVSTSETLPERSAHLLFQILVKIVTIFLRRRSPPQFSFAQRSKHFPENSSARYSRTFFILPQRPYQIRSRGRN